MRRPIVQALGWDALYQVLDNWVFRILAGLTLIPILFTFLLGFREDEIVFLFGLQRWEYGSFLDVLSTLAGGGPGISGAIEDKQGLMIESVLQIFLEQTAGTIGVLFCIAATAFFVPRMLEKGAAEVFFHKPVSRGALYLSRYFAGLLFIGLVSLVMVGGMYLGLSLVSGHHDPGILLAALNLTYLFGLVYSFSMLVGVVTRSSVAAILLTTIFFFFNGCIHQIWIVKEMGFDKQRIDRMEDVAADEAAGTDAPEPDLETPDESEEDPLTAFQRALLWTLDAFHFVLPKTSDADVIATKLRRAVDPPVYRDPESRITFFRLPKGTEQVDPDSIDPFPEALRERFGEICFALASQDPPATIVLARRPFEEVESKIGTRTRMRRETTSQAAEKLEAQLAEDPAVRGLARESIRVGSNAKGTPASGSIVRWTQDEAGAVRTRAALLFKGADSATLYTLWVDAEGALDEAQRTELMTHVDRSMGLDANPLSEESWYSKQLGLTAPLRYNILFSIGSSLAFAGALLAIGWLKLRKIDF